MMGMPRMLQDSQLFRRVAQRPFESHVLMTSSTPQPTGAAAPSVLPGFQYRGLSRNAPVVPCVLSMVDLRRLYNEFGPMARDAMSRHIDEIARSAHQTEEEFAAGLELTKSLGIVTVAMEGMDGEQIVYSSAQALEEAALPHRLKQITFDSAAAIQQHNVTPKNRFSVRLDFTEPPGFNVYNPWDQPTPNNSRIEVIGPDQTWVTGVFESTTRFFQNRRRRRGWLHSATTFTLLQYAIGFPAALWIVYRLDSSGFRRLVEIHSAVKGAIYVYVFLMALLVFRVIIGGFRWLFPIIELEGTRTRAVRVVVGTVFGSIFLSLVYDVLKTVFWP
jgi:hypothetical protein